MKLQLFVLLAALTFSQSTAFAQGSDEVKDEAAKLWEEQVKEDKANATKPKTEEAPPADAPKKTISDVTKEEKKKEPKKSKKKKDEKKADEKADPKAEAKALKAEKGKGDEKAEEKKGDEKKEKAEVKPVPPPADDDITVKVIKAKSGKALILHSKKIKLEKTRYSLGAWHKPGEDDDEPSRRWFIGGSMDMGLFSQTTTVGTTESKSDYKTFVLNMSGGRNFGILEVGPFMEYAFVTIGTADTKTLLAGLLIDINIGRNDIDADGLFGIRLSAGVGQEDASTLTEAGKVTRIQPSLFFKWFLSEEAALVIEAGYRMQNTEFGSIKTATTGPVSRIGVTGYF
ncbi:MAG: hypothetical protein ABL958_02375 [Bdellovibrionia bacterium]